MVLGVWQFELGSEILPGAKGPAVEADLNPSRWARRLIGWVENDACAENRGELPQVRRRYRLPVQLR